MRTIVRVIDSISNGMAKTISWACVALVGVLVYEVTARYVFNAPTIWAHEIAPMLGVAIVALGWAHTHCHDGHVRVDIFYSRLSARGKAIIDVVGSLLFLFPLLIVLIYVAANHTWFAWSMGEVFKESILYPPAWPLRATMLLGLSLFTVQGVALFIRDLYLLIREKPL